MDSAAHSPLHHARKRKERCTRAHPFDGLLRSLSLSIFPCSLYEFIKNNNFKGISLGLIRRFAIQLLQSLKFLRGERIIHCDLKP